MVEDYLDKKSLKRGFYLSVLGIIIIVFFFELAFISLFSGRVLQIFADQQLLSIRDLIESGAKDDIYGKIDVNDLKSEASQAALAGFANHVEGLETNIGMVIYSSEGDILWSDIDDDYLEDHRESHDTEEIEEMEDDHVSVALSGTTIITSAEEELRVIYGAKEISEIYLPFAFIENGNIDSVIELYVDETAILNNLEEIRNLVILLTGVLLFLITTILSIAFSGQNSIIRSQSNKLSKYAKGLEVMVNDRTKELKISEARFRTIVTQSQAIIFMTDEKGIFLLSEGLALKSLGLEPGEVVGKSAFDVYKNYPAVIKGLKSAQSGKIYKDIIEISGMFFDIFYSPYRDDTGKILGMMGMAIDITARQEAEAALIESEEKFKAITESAHDSIIAIDKDLRITFWNFAVEKTFGYSAEEISKKLITELIKGDLNISELQGEVHELSGLKQDGTEFDIELSVSELKLKDQDKYVVIIRDISSRKSAEAKIHDLDVLKTRFITALTHVARTPLNEIRWGLEALLSGDFGELTKEQKTFLRRTLESESNVLNLITNMNTTLDIERGTMVFNKSKSSVESLVRSVVVDYAPECQIKDITCKIAETQIKFPSISVDSEKMRLAFSMIYDNALKYSEKGSEINLSFKKNGNWMEIYIADKGIGIPEAEQSNISDRFFRASNAHKMHTDGIGLGLYITKAIVEAHGGKLGFKSVEGEGSTFWIKLPIK